MCVWVCECVWMRVLSVWMFLRKWKDERQAKPISACVYMTVSVCIYVCECQWSSNPTSQPHQMQLVSQIPFLSHCIISSLSLSHSPGLLASFPLLCLLALVFALLFYFIGHQLVSSPSTAHSIWCIHIFPYGWIHEQQNQPFSLAAVAKGTAPSFLSRSLSLSFLSHRSPLGQVVQHCIPQHCLFNLYRYMRFYTCIVP